MPTRFRIGAVAWVAIGLALAWSLAAQTGRGQETSAADLNIAPAKGYEEVAQRLSAAIAQELEQKRIPALSMALVDGDSTVWAWGFGFEDAQQTRPASAGTIYRVGSVSKLFTDVAIMQLVEQGQLDLDAPVTNYLPDFQPHNPFGQPISLRQLMTHLSGVVREPPVGHYFDADPPWLADTIASLNQTSLVYAPGSRTKYSNAGVSVAGRVLETRPGVTESFERLLEQRILAPLGMADSSFALDDRLRPRLTEAWMWTYDGRRFIAPQFALGTGPAGNLYATMPDLAKFLQAMFSDPSREQPLLSAESWRAMFAASQDASGRPTNFGLGFHTGQLDGRALVGHGGAVYGFSTQLEALPDERLGVAFAASLDGCNGVVRRLAEYALRLLLARRDDAPLPQWRGSGPVSPQRAAQLVGRYAREGREVAIDTDADRLVMRRGDFLRQLKANEDGLIIDDVLGQGPTIQLAADGALQVGDETWSPVDDKQPDPPPQRWAGLIGEYGWDHNILYIFEDRGRLFALIEWFYFYELNELGEDEFAFPDHGLYHGEKVVFSRDDQGQASTAVAAGIAFPRRELGVRDGATFRIQPVRPIDDLRVEALRAQPPAENGEFLSPDLVEVTSLSDTIRLDIRYATTNNFMGEVFYRQPRAFLQRPAAEALVRVQQRLRPRGLGLLIHDAYRPWHVTKMFWDATPAELKNFVANPANGSRHNRGCAVDLTLCDLETGEPLEMVAGYDEFSARSSPHYPGGAGQQRWRRNLLRRAMEAEGWKVYEFEWWHFDFQDWGRYPILNQTFEEL